MTEAQRIEVEHSVKQLYLIDAMALAYRSHFVFINRPLINSKGQNTSAAYGFTNALMKLIEDHRMANMAVVFDAISAEGEERTFRDELYDAYKANRSPMPEDLIANLPYIKQIVKALDIPVIEIPGVEADDVIGTLARRAADEGAHVVIVSPDKDFQQLLDPCISICRPSHRGEEFDPITMDSFREKYGLEPLQFIDMLALMGDTTDNVPGVPGIGEKTAMQLLQDYGSVEALIEHAPEVKGKRAREGLIEHRDDALISKKLVTIKTDLDLEVDWDTFHRARPNKDSLLALFGDLEFSTLFQKVQRGEWGVGAGETTFGDGAAVDEAAMPEREVRSYDEESVEYRTVRNRNQLMELFDRLIDLDRIAIDTEGTSTDPMWSSLVGISFSWDRGQACYVPTPLPDGTSTSEVCEVLAPIFMGPALKVGHNLKYDVVTLMRHGIKVAGPLFDTMVAHYLIAPEEPHGLDGLTPKYLSYRMVPKNELVGSGRSQLSLRDVPLDQMCAYGCENSDIALQLADLLKAELEREGLIDIAEHIEFPLILVLADMEMTGIRVDPELLRVISEELDTQIKMLELEAYMLAGGEFNLGSTQQLGEILFENLGLRKVSKTSKGSASTKESVLEELSTEHPLPGIILDWRKLTKLKSTYVDSLGELIHPETGRIHTNFNQTVAATGRLSSSGPNLQNIPIRTDTGREVRKAFVAEKGKKLLAADYVQIELRILASMSGDEGFRTAFERGEDIHTTAAASIYNIPASEVTREQRGKAKAVNFGIPYGISPWGLAQRLRISQKEAQALIDKYMQTFSRVTVHINNTINEAHEKGYVQTLMGRRRYVPNINSRNRTQRSFAERVAVNMPIQGTQADMIKIAMIRIHEHLKREKMQAKMLLQVHDELVFEALDEELDRLREIVRSEMVGAIDLGVPVEVGVNVGDNWLDAH